MSLEFVIENFSDYFDKLKDDKLVMFILIVLLSLYSSLWVESLKNYTINIFSNKYFKFIIFVLITYIASSNPALGVILAIAMLVTLQTITYTTYMTNTINTEKESEKFSPSQLTNENKYLNNPLLKQNELTKMGNNLNLKLQTPTEYYEKMIKQGRILLDDSLELKNDIKTRFDIREQTIANNTERDGKILVQSGINRLQKSDNGEYNSWLDNQTSNLSFGLTENKLTENKKTSYIKYDRFIENYSDNELIMDLFNLLKTKYNEITMNKSLSKDDFEIKLQEIYDTEFDLLIAIYDVKTKKMNSEENEKVQKKIEQIKELRNNKNLNYYNELHTLSELLCN
jgi:hypothetical protein